MTLDPRRVDDKKEAERLAHLQRKAEEAARSGRGRVNPFPLNVQRSASGQDESDVVQAPSVHAPMVPTDFGGIHALYSAAALEVLLAKLQSALEKNSGSPRVTVKHSAAKVSWVELLSL